MNPEIAAAFEFGFRCAEKGMNLQRAQEELAKAYTPRSTPVEEPNIRETHHQARIHQILYHHD